MELWGSRGEFKWFQQRKWRQSFASYDDFPFRKCGANSHIFRGSHKRQQLRGPIRYLHDHGESQSNHWRGSGPGDMFWAEHRREFLHQFGSRGRIYLELIECKYSKYRDRIFGAFGIGTIGGSIHCEFRNATLCAELFNNPKCRGMFRCSGYLVDYSYASTRHSIYRRTFSSVMQRTKFRLRKHDQCHT